MSCMRSPSSRRRVRLLPVFLFFSSFFLFFIYCIGAFTAVMTARTMTCTRLPSLRLAVSCPHQSLVALPAVMSPLSCLLLWAPLSRVILPRTIIPYLRHRQLLLPRGPSSLTRKIRRPVTHIAAAASIATTMLLMLSLTLI